MISNDWGQFADNDFEQEALNELQEEHDAYIEEARERDQQMHEEYMETVSDLTEPGDLSKSTYKHWQGDEQSKHLDEHPPFYPFNTFALRDNNCSACHDKVYAPGWYFRFLHLQSNTFMCEKCHNLTWEQFLNYKFGKNYFFIKDYITNGIGKEIISMLSKQALTN